MISYFPESKGYQSRRQRAYFFLNMRNVCKLTFEYTSGLGLFRYSALQDLGLKMLCAWTTPTYPLSTFPQIIKKI